MYIRRLATFSHLQIDPNTPSSKSFLGGRCHSFTLHVKQKKDKAGTRWHHQRAHLFQTPTPRLKQITNFSWYSHCTRQVWTKMSRWHHCWHISLKMLMSKPAWCSTDLTNYPRGQPARRREGGKYQSHDNLNKAICDRTTSIVIYQFTSFLIRLVRPLHALPKDPMLTRE